MHEARHRSVVAAAAVLIGVGCASASTAGGDATSHTPMPSMGGHGMDDDRNGANFAFGEPGDPSAADRTIEVATLDTLRFDPEIIEVRAGETVTFVVSNPGLAPHEFVIGDAGFQAQHADEMAGMSGSPMHDDPNAVAVAPGATAEITWTFDGASSLQFACHVPGHFEGGMVGRITVA